MTSQVTHVSCQLQDRVMTQWHKNESVACCIEAHDLVQTGMAIAKHGQCCL